LVLDRNKIAALLESLCERPFAGDPEAPRPQDIAHRAAQALSKGQEAESSAAVNADVHAASSAALRAGADEGSIPPAALAAILSGTATAAQCDAFQDAAATSRAVRLEAQSALAFVDGIEQAPQMAPAHLVQEVLAQELLAQEVLAQEVLASTRTDPTLAAASGGSSFWSRLVPRRQAAAAFAVLLLGGGLSWSLLWRGGNYDDQTSPVVPAAFGPEEPQFRVGAPAPAGPIVTAPGDRVPVVASPPTPSTRARIAPQGAGAMLPSLSAPDPEQALADPCAPRARSAPPQIKVEVSDGIKRAPSPPPKSAAAAVPEPSCEARRGLQGPSVEQAKEAADPPADKGAIYQPASRIDRTDPAAAIAPVLPRAGAARSAAPLTGPAADQAR